VLALAAASGILLQALQQLRHGLAAMADAVLVRRCQLGGTGIFGRDPEQRIVAEAVLAAWCAQNAPAPNTLADDGGRITRMAGSDDAAMKTGAAPAVGHLLERGQQLAIIGRIIMRARI